MSSRADTTTSGWSVFAAVILIMNGLMLLLQGLVVLIDPTRYVATGTGTLFILNLTGWGWFALIAGALQLATGCGLIAGAIWARGLAVVLAVVSSIGQLLLLPVQPWWSLIVIAVDVLIIYAVLVQDDGLRARKEARSGQTTSGQTRGR